MAKITYTGRSIMPQEYLQVREELGLAPVGFALAARALRDDVFDIVVLLDGETPVGMGRVIGDGVLTFYLQDVCVVPRCQRRGIGSRIVALMLENLRAIAAPGAFVGLVAPPGTEAFFAKCGFAPRPAGASGMELVAKGDRSI